VEEIVVTGQKQAAIKQDEAVSVTSFDMQDLVAQGTTDLSGIAKFTPNLEIKSAFAASNQTLFIRGVGLKDYFANASSAVAVWNDGVYMNSPTGQLFQLFDVENVEVLKGPQGSRYARNATAGAILVAARRPSNQYDANFMLEYGNFEYYTVGGAANVPLVDDLLSARIAFRANKRDGITENRCADPRFALGIGAPVNSFFCNHPFTVPRPILGAKNNVNDVNNWAARGLVRLTPWTTWTGY
jgi:iron complex outermembrane receptor protein